MLNPDLEDVRGIAREAMAEGFASTPHLSLTPALAGLKMLWLIVGLLASIVAELRLANARKPARKSAEE
jgi:hypothetical protein